MQNRIALDILLAKQGGVCAYDDAHDDAHGTISDTVKKMRKTIDAIRKDEQGDTIGWEWFFSVFRHWTPYVSINVPVLVTILFICLFGPCLLQCF